jgi:hypothetical protein
MATHLHNPRVQDRQVIRYRRRGGPFAEIY